MLRPTTRVSVLVVDDEPELLEVMQDWLKYAGYEVATARHGMEALSILREKRVDVVVTDLMMPGMSGLDLLALVKEQYPSTQVLILSGHGTIEDAIAALRGGRAVDYLQKPLRDLNLLNQAIERAMTQRPAPVAVPVGLSAGAGKVPLSRRERDIVRLLASGSPNEEIARQLALSPKTVRNHLSHIFQKLGVHNRTQAVLACQARGLV